MAHTDSITIGTEKCRWGVSCICNRASLKLRKAQGSRVREPGLRCSTPFALMCICLDFLTNVGRTFCPSMPPTTLRTDRMSVLQSRVDAIDGEKPGLVQESS